MYYVPKKISPEAAAIYGVLSILVSCLAGFSSVTGLARLPSEPQHMTISDALSKVGEQPLWVILDDIQWDCEHAFILKELKPAELILSSQTKTK